MNEPIVELSEAELQRWFEHAMTDTGFVARELLGFNYDLDWKNEGRKINVGTGGVRDEPPYTTMCEAMASPEDQLLMELAPRGGLKSSCALADVVRAIIGNPDSANLYMSGTDPQVRTKSRGVRRVFERNENLRRVFGLDDLRGTPWTIDEWTVAMRTDVTVVDPTFRTGSLKRPPTGGHYQRIYLDDLIDWRNCRSIEQLELARMVLGLVLPLRVPGGKIIVLGTRYNPGDIYSHIDSLPGWRKLVLGTGFEIEEQKDGLFRLVGERPMFPNLPREFLEQQLASMPFEDFCAQYLNRHVAGLSAAFRRHDFQAVPWDDRMADLSCWILTDSATSRKKGASFSVALLVGIDKARRIYLLDGFVGRVEPFDYVNELFALHVRWMDRVQLLGWTMEAVTHQMVYKSWIETESVRRGIRLNIREIPRGGDRDKDDRILRVQPTVRARDLFVVDTFPRTFRDGLQLKSLWDPQGYLDTNTQQKLPGGELVEQFAQFPYYPWKDIADAISDVAYKYKDGQWACYWRVPRDLARYDERHIATPVDSWNDRGQDWLRSLGRAPR